MAAPSMGCTSEAFWFNGGYWSRISSGLLTGPVAREAGKRIRRARDLFHFLLGEWTRPLADENAVIVV